MLTRKLQNDSCQDAKRKRVDAVELNTGVRRGEISEPAQGRFHCVVDRCTCSVLCRLSPAEDSLVSRPSLRHRCRCASGAWKEAVERARRVRVPTITCQRIMKTSPRARLLAQADDATDGRTGNRCRTKDAVRARMPRCHLSRGERAHRWRSIYGKQQQWRPRVNRHLDLPRDSMNADSWPRRLLGTSTRRRKEAHY